MVFRRIFGSAEPSDLKLVVGLGNIGQQYAHTRHNVGFDIADEIARRQHVRFRSGKFKGEEVTVHLAGQRVLLLKPHTLMNLSGDAVVAAKRFYKLVPTQILVICDDMYLPVGRMRFRPSGGEGGHNGLWSVINRLGTKDIPRLRIGIDEPPASMDGASYVLNKFTPNERRVIDRVVISAADAVETWVSDGIDAAMNKWNGYTES